jgi:hypothetical protein
VLNEKLKQANKQSFKKQTKIAVTITSVMGVSLLAVGGITNWTSDLEFQKNLIPEIQVKSAPEDPSKDRELFKDELSEYESQVEPKLSDANLERWNEAKNIEIEALKERATASFSTGKYAAALESLRQAKVAVQDVLKERDTIFDEAMANAIQSFHKNIYEESKLHIDRALTVKPNSKYALEVSEKIEVLPQIMQLLEKAKIAQIENNLDKEYAALKKITGLDPARTNLRIRADELSKEINERRFAQYVESGLDHIDQRKLSGAKKSLAEGRRIYPSRPELDILKKKISFLEKEIKLERAVNQANSAIEKDDWSAVHAIYSNAIKDNPENQHVVDGLKVASEIISLNETITKYLGSPYRLASKNISRSAMRLLDQAGEYSSKSQSLGKRSLELQNLIQKFTKDVEVRVVSDNQTNILVRGVGVVGLTLDKIIKLKPGVYTFEGTKPGYKAKLVKVKIPPDQMSFKVEVFCDERI